MARGVVLEKRGYLRAKVGALQRNHELLTAARSDYDEALSVTADLRRQLKIRAGRTTVQFLLATTSDQRRAWIVELREVIAEAEAAGSAASEVVRVGRENLDRMLSNRTDLEAYEVL